MKYLADAAFSAVLAWQKQLDLDIRNKVAPELKVLKSTDRTEGEKIVASADSPTEKELVTAV